MYEKVLNCSGSECIICSVDIDFHKSSIRSRPSRLSEGLGAVEIFFWWRQIVAAVKAVHDHDIVHCDLKPHNFILFRQWRRSMDNPEELGTGPSVPVEHEKYMLKLCDFGVSRELEDSATHVSEHLPVGTIRYMAPEVLHDCRSNGKLWIGKAADNWSIGVVLHQMLHKGLTPHSHFERLGHKVKLILAIADPKSARVMSSCPRLLLTSQPSQSTGNESAARLASARHATLIGLQSVCLQFVPENRANTQHLASVTEKKKRLFFGSVAGEHEIPAEDGGGPTGNYTTDIVGDSEQAVLFWSDVGKIDHATDAVAVFGAEAGEEPRRSSEERSVRNLDVPPAGKKTSKGRRLSRRTSSASDHAKLSGSTDAEEERRTSWSPWLVVMILLIAVAGSLVFVWSVFYVWSVNMHRGDSSAAPDGAVEALDADPCDSPVGAGGGGSSPQLEPPARSKPLGGPTMSLGLTPDPGGARVPGALWGPTPKPEPKLIQRVFSEENPVWEVFYQCECQNIETQKIDGRMWTRGWLGRGRIPSSEDFVDAVRRIGTDWADSETEVLHFMRDKDGSAPYYAKPKFLTAEMCLTDTFGDCAKTYDPSHRLSFLETSEPWRLSTLLIRKRKFTL